MAWHPRHLAISSRPRKRDEGIFDATNQASNALLHPSCIAAPSEWRKYFCEVDGRNDGILQTQLLRSLGCVSLDSSEVARIPRVPSHRARVQRCSEHLPEREGGRSQLLSGPPSRSALRSPTGRTRGRAEGRATLALLNELADAADGSRRTPLLSFPDDLQFSS